ncbi:MAG: ABC transporter ATP-binding protein [Firmicutes bacterium]|nr:ABC transporter ATP-binding protein [Bacillota bacterium]
MNALEGRRISFSYPRANALFSEVNIQVQVGECVILRGPSGCGKTTLCQILAGIIPRSLPGEVRGDVLLFGENIGSLSLARIVEKVGVLFQDPDAQLFFPTVEDEIAFGPENLCLAREEIGCRIEQALEAVQMSEYRLAKTETLSYGQKQLIALAAVLALEPRVLILDEAFSQLDTASTQLVKEIIRNQKRLGRAIFLVENSEEHLDLAERVYELQGGRVQEVVL